MRSESRQWSHRVSTFDPPPGVAATVDAISTGMSKVSFAGRVVVITGAGSGIGRALAIALAGQGALLGVSDIDRAGLDDTANRCSNAGATVRADLVDVTNREAMTGYAADVAARFGRINIVFNNAGVIFTGDITESSYDDIERVIDVDFWGVVNGTKAFLPYLIESGGGHLVNISSAFGLVAAPGYSAYNAAKFAVRGFTEAVQQEMQSAGHLVHVSCVLPRRRADPHPPDGQVRGG